ncbi:MAG: hypothetical protein H7125_14855, partial [Proteobacteria bacterium]|nr:hypothetical protein [Burkholderiales bacterium]
MRTHVVPGANLGALTQRPHRFEAPVALFQSPPLPLLPRIGLFGLAVIASLSFHLIVLAVNFNAGANKPRATAPQPLEVVLVNARTVQAPSKADVRAQVNLDGGGNTDEA